MSGALGTLTVVLLEAAVGGAVVLWLAGLAGAARRGFFVLSGAVLAALAWGAWLLARAAIDQAGQRVDAGAQEASAAAATGAAGEWLLWSVLAFAALLTVWLAVLVATDTDAGAPLGVVAAAAGVVALGPTAAVRGGDVALGAVELLLGAALLGTALHGLVLGHWYLFQRRLAEHHMRRSARLYAGGVVAGVGALALSALNPEPPLTGAASPLLTIPGFSLLLGAGLLAICGLIAPFLLRLAAEGGRSIQAATGYFYLAVIMAFSAEVATKFRFFL